jgi:ComF family protein
VPVCPECLAAPRPLEAEYYCRQCHTPFLNPRPLGQDGRCRLCQSGLTLFDASYSFGAYAGNLRELIHLFKFGGVRALARPLGRLLAVALPRDGVLDAIVPMPLHWRRRLKRGFNQSELLAAEVARRTGIPMVKALKKRHHTAAQTGLSRAARRRNLRRVFGVSRPALVRGRRLLLIDDVFTTGATANAAAAALKDGGAARVTVLTLARADRLRAPVAMPALKPAARAAGGVGT